MCYYKRLYSLEEGILFVKVGREYALIGSPADIPRLLPEFGVIVDGDATDMMNGSDAEVEGVLVL